MSKKKTCPLIELDQLWTFPNRPLSEKEKKEMHLVWGMLSDSTKKVIEEKVAELKRKEKFKNG